jgi:hypothetical protein
MPGDLRLARARRGDLHGRVIALPDAGAAAAPAALGLVTLSSQAIDQVLDGHCDPSLLPFRALVRVRASPFSISRSLDPSIRQRAPVLDAGR